MRFMGLMFAVAALGVTSQAYSPPSNIPTGSNPNGVATWNSVTLGDREDTEAGWCDWDCGDDNDDDVGIIDLLALLSQWGMVGTSCDRDGLGGVGIGDFLGLLGNWGPCP